MPEMSHEARDVDVGRTPTVARSRIELQAEPFRARFALDMAFPLVAVVAQGTAQRPGGRKSLGDEIKRHFVERGQVGGLTAAESDLHHQARGTGQQPPYRRLFTVGE